MSVANLLQTDGRINPIFLPPGSGGAQTLSLSGDDITLSGGGGTVDVGTATTVAATAQKTTAQTYDGGLLFTAFSGLVKADEVLCEAAAPSAASVAIQPGNPEQLTITGDNDAELRMTCQATGKASIKFNTDPAASTAELAYTDAGQDLTLKASRINLDGIPSAAPALANVLSYDPATKEVKYQAAGGGGVSAPLDLQPPLGYLYPLNPQYGVNIQNWDNPTANPTNPLQIADCRAETQINGLSMTEIKTDCNPFGVAQGIKIEGVRTTVLGQGSCNGINVSGCGTNAFTNNPEAQNAIGVNADNIGSAGGSFAIGLKTSAVNGRSTSTATGVDVFEVETVDGDAKGMRIAKITAGQVLASGVPTPATGLDIERVQTGSGNTGAVNGIKVNNVYTTDTSQAVNGINVIGVNSVFNSGGTSRGVLVQAIGAFNTGFGNRETGNAIGVEVNGLASNNGASAGSCKGVLIQNLDGLSFANPATGVELLNVASGVASVGVKGQTILGGSSSAGVDLQQITSGTNSATGVYVRDVIKGLGAGGGPAVDFAAGVRVEGVNMDLAMGTTYPPAYGMVLSRTGTAPFNTKSPSSNGSLLKLANGNAQFAVQFINDPVAPVINHDGGNHCLIDVASAPNITITAPLGGANYEDGTTLWLSKNHAGGHNIIDGTGLNTFNGLPGPFVYGGGAYNNCYLVFYNGNWWANVF